MSYSYPVRLILTLVWLSGAVAAPAQEQPAKAAAKKAGEPDRDGRLLLLETVGTLAGSQLYQTYLNIGFIADGKAEGTYETKDATQLLSSVLGLLDTLDKQLEKVAKLDLDKDDRDGVDQVRKLSALLRRQGKELLAFWESGDKKRGEQYEKLRQEAWEGISKLLGLEDKEPAKK